MKYTLDEIKKIIENTLPDAHGTDAERIIRDLVEELESRLTQLDHVIRERDTAQIQLSHRIALRKEIEQVLELEENSTYDQDTFDIAVRRMSDMKRELMIAISSLKFIASEDGWEGAGRQHHAKETLKLMGVE